MTPNPGTVLLGETLAFTASVSNSTDTSVFWSVNGITGGSPQAGTISADGVYTAPADLPPGGTVQVTATSHADSSKFASVDVTVFSDITVSLSPGTVNVELGAVQAFHASISSDGKPDPTIRWSLSGSSCPNSCGSVGANGNYTAPQILPGNASVTLTATSVADPSKQNSAGVLITSNFSLQLTAPATVQPGVTAALVATMTPVPGSNPSSALSWSLSGTGCSGSACGILTVTTTQSAGGNSIANTANYTAPAAVPQPDTVTVTVTPQADPTKAQQANITIAQGAGLSISPPTATLADNERITLTASLNGATNNGLSWSVNGVSGGNTTLGQICVVGSNPCQSLTSGTATQADYLAPGAIPAPNPVSVTVTSAGNPNLTASAQITVINHVLVSVQPNNVTLPPLGVQGFTASVLGTNNQNVVWQIQGTGCTSSGLCGSITPAGTYTAPAVAPTPDALTVVAISQDDTSQSGSANVTISTGPNILSLHPASVYAGGADGFTVSVDGSGFAPSQPGPGSVLQIGGTARITTCSSVNSCSAPVSSTDVALAGNLSIQIVNPDTSTSNVVDLVIVTPGSGEDVVTLTSNSPAATGKDITVVEPTTAGLDNTDSNLDLEVAAIGLFTTSTNTCTLAGNPILLVRPSSGTVAADICLFSQAGFDTSMSYTVSGSGDVAVIAQQPAGLGIIHLTLQVPASATVGARTLFIQNVSLDRTAASGALEIQ
ncbi:MAG TPA: hypothetical protein VJY15_04490 [Candidatus Acidoferrum sp.]|nr:hypothetical protein [Candidatus Acidoferrum sp.]